MKIKRILTMLVAMIVMMSMVISVNADKQDDGSDFIRDLNIVNNSGVQDEVVRVRYLLKYYSSMHCVKASTVVTYLHDIESQYNLPAYISMTVIHSTGNTTITNGGYMVEKYSNLSTPEYYIPSNSILVSAEAKCSVNKKVTYNNVLLYKNSNYTEAEDTLYFVYP